MRKAEDKARRIAAANRLKEQAENLEKWRNGEDVRAYFEATALRLKGDVIQTSRGAEIPKEHAIKLWPLLSKLHAAIRGDDVINLRENGRKLGVYTVDSLSRHILQVGCHAIPYSEVLAVAKQLELA